MWVQCDNSEHCSKTRVLVLEVNCRMLGVWIILERYRRSVEYVFVLGKSYSLLVLMTLPLFMASTVGGTVIIICQFTFLVSGY